MKYLVCAHVWWPMHDNDTENTETMDGVPVAPTDAQWSSITHLGVPKSSLGKVTHGLCWIFYRPHAYAHSEWLEKNMRGKINSEAALTIYREIFATYGSHEVVVTDNGHSFTNNVFLEFMRLNGLKFHPASMDFLILIKKAFKNGIQETKDVQIRLSKFLFHY